jgi:hypothetical protein
MEAGWIFSLMEELGVRSAVNGKGVFADHRKQVRFGQECTRVQLHEGYCRSALNERMVMPITSNKQLRSER